MNGYDYYGWNGFNFVKWVWYRFINFKNEFYWVVYIS